MGRFIIAWLVVGCIATTATLAQEPAPKGPFKAVHLVTLTDAEAATIQNAIAEMNGAVAKAGHPDIRYRLYKVTGKQAGSFNYLWESSWPNGEVYQKVHDSPEWVATMKKLSGLEPIMKNEIYNRYVEVATKTK